MSDAADSLWARHHQTIERVICQVCAAWHLDLHGAEELAQDLRLYVLEHDAKLLCAYSGRSTIGTYLFRVMTRRAGRWVRRCTRRATIEKACGDTFEGYGTWGTEWLGRECGATDNSERNQAALHALPTLTSVEQQLIHLRFWQELPWHAVAASTGLSCKAAENRMYRALDRLRRAAQPAACANSGRSLGSHRDARESNLRRPAM